MSGVFPVVVWRLTLVDLLLMLALLVIVPLGLRLVPFVGPRSRQALTVARIVQPFGAASAVVSFLFTPGWTAGVIALGWLLTCAVASLAGLVELIERRSLRPVHLVPAAAVAYLSVGAGWLVGLAIAPRVQLGPARWFLWVSAAGVVVPMLLGVDYAISRVVAVPALDLRAMALIHGDLNALVFSLCGLLGWTLIGRPAPSGLGSEG